MKWAEPYQIDNYLQFQDEKDMPVFVIIGIGGTPDKPEHLYFTALKNIAPFSNQPESYLNKFSRSTETTFYFDTATGALR